METNKNYDIINRMVETQLNDPMAIRMGDDGITFVYRFALTPEEATALSLPADISQADITLDLMMEFMTVIGLDAAGNPIANGEYPTDIKGLFIRTIFDLYGQKVKAKKEADAAKKESSIGGNDTKVQEAPAPSAAAMVSAALSQISIDELMNSQSPIPFEIGSSVPFEINSSTAFDMGSFIPAESTGNQTTFSSGEEALTSFLKSESKKQVRRFYLNYPATGKDGSPLHLYIETEVDEDDPSYINYWVGCEEFTEKHYIASCQAALDQEMPLEIVKVKHLQAYVEKITK